MLIQNWISIISLLGLLLSIYALYVERKIEIKKNYKPICDISEDMSCSKAFTSSYSRAAGFSNSTGGIIFYILMLSLIFLGYPEYVFYLSVGALLGSAYLAYVLYFRLKNTCIVCTAIYIINVTIFILSYFWLF
jgi:vitamin-K-epoxide reductase (warfarin-sensitive)